MSLHSLRLSALQPGEGSALFNVAFTVLRLETQRVIVSVTSPVAGSGVNSELLIARITQVDRLFKQAPQPNIHGVQDTASTLYSDAVVLVSFVPRDLRFVHAKSGGEFPLCHAARNAQTDQGVTQAVEVEEFPDIATLQALVTLHLLLKLQVERAQRVQCSFQLFVTEPHLHQSDSVSVQPLAFIVQACKRFLILGFVANHGAPMILGTHHQHAHA